jgi:hypothetical protein
MSDIPTLRAKFVGGPRDKKTRSLPSPKAPMVIECPEDCKFHNVRGRYVKRGMNQTNVVLYDWEPQA